MIPIKYSEVSTCSYSYYGCKDRFCPINKLHTSIETHFAITDIPRWCLKTVDMCSDESINSVVREWIKESNIKGQIYFMPREVRDIIECKKPKISAPLFRWMRGENINVGKSIVIPNDGKQPCIKNLIWHFRKHAMGFLYKIYFFRFIHLIYVELVFWYFTYKDYQTRRFIKKCRI